MVKKMVNKELRKLNTRLRVIESALQSSSAKSERLLKAEKSAKRARVIELENQLDSEGLITRIFTPKTSLSHG